LTSIEQVSPPDVERTRAIKPFFDRDYGILIRVSNIKKVTRFTGLSEKAMSVFV